MKTNVTIALLCAVGVAVVIHPAAAQRRGALRAPARMASGSLLFQIASDFDDFATDMELTDRQRSLVEGLINDFNAEHPEALSRITMMRDSIRDVRPGRRGMRRGPGRELIEEYGELVQELRPAFAEFQQDIGDVLTWNQGKEAMHEYGPGMGSRGFRGESRRWGRGYRRGPSAGGRAWHRSGRPPVE